jgi:hypothetical protein
MVVTAAHEIRRCSYGFGNRHVVNVLVCALDLKITASYQLLVSKNLRMREMCAETCRRIVL